MFHCDHAPECSGPSEHMDVNERANDAQEDVELMNRVHVARAWAERYLYLGEFVKAERSARRADEIENALNARKGI